MSKIQIHDAIYTASDPMPRSGSTRCEGSSAATERVREASPRERWPVRGGPAGHNSSGGPDLGDASKDMPSIRIHQTRD